MSATPPSSPPSSDSSRSSSPGIVLGVAPPTPGEEKVVEVGSSYPSVVDNSTERPSGGDDKANDNANGIRKYTDMGWPGHKFAYTLLTEEKAEAEFVRLAGPTVRRLSSSSCSSSNPSTFLRGIYAASIQPHPDPANHSQDRYIAEEWDMPDKSVWRFRAVFDGHAAGDETVDYTTGTLPGRIKSALGNLITATADADADADGVLIESVSSMLRSTISALDDSITQGILDVFPTVESIEKLSDEEIRAIVNDRASADEDGADARSSGPYHARGPNNIKITRGMRGTTVLVVLMSPQGGVWTASLGDCQAILGIKQSTNTLNSQPQVKWRTAVLSANHNASEPNEVTRLKSEHAGEEEVVVANRVLGIIAVTKAIGDHPFKLPPIYTTRVFAQTLPGFNRPPTLIKAIEDRCLTPPYLSALPDVEYFDLRKSARLETESTKEEGTSSHLEAFLILCSDGLMDLYGGEDRQERPADMSTLFQTWAEMVGRKLEVNRYDDENANANGDVDAVRTLPERNLALYLLREGMRGPLIGQGTVGQSGGTGNEVHLATEHGTSAEKEGEQVVQSMEEEKPLIRRQDSEENEKESELKLRQHQLERLSSMLTLESGNKWMDDTTCIVEVL